MAVEFQNQEFQDLESTEKGAIQQNIRDNLAKQIDSFDFAQSKEQKADIQSAFGSMLEAIDGLDVDLQALSHIHPLTQTSAMQNLLQKVDTNTQIRDFLLTCHNPQTGKFPLDKKMWIRLWVVEKECVGAKLKEKEEETNRKKQILEYEKDEGEKLDETIGENKETIQKYVDNFNNTLKSEKNVLANNPDLAKELKPVSELDKLTTPDQQIAFATDQLGYDQAQATEIVQNYQNSQYAQAWLSIGQLLSFLQTEQALWNKGIDSDPFLADVAKIRDDLQISAPKTKKRNLTCSQIQFFVM